jgi:membrane protease YdiL (CAAX protease family)
MIDRFTKIADALQFLRLPSVVVGLVCLVGAVTIVVSSNSHGGDLYLIPSVVGMLWAIATYTFLASFRSVPPKAASSWGLFRRLKRRAVRTGYWFMAAVFLATTVGVIVVSYRMLAVWFSDY